MLFMCSGNTKKTLGHPSSAVLGYGHHERCTLLLNYEGYHVNAVKRISKGT